MVAGDNVVVGAMVSGVVSGVGVPRRRQQL